MRVGILGGGQLAQMIAQAGHTLGMEFLFLCPDPQACAAPYGEHICAPFAKQEAIRRMASQADVVTYEFENVPVALVEQLAQRLPLHPPAAALAVARDRLQEKSTFRALGIPTAEFVAVDSPAELEEALRSIGYPAILKTRTQGYDGKGQVVLRDAANLAAAWREVGEVPCIVEQMISFARELSILAVRGRSGELAFYPLSENHHRDGILRLSIARPEDPLQARAEQLIQRLLQELDYIGVLALELFEVDGQLYANEMAPRVHNSGHWTIEGACTSQFENHLRAIAGLPLGATTVQQPVAMVNLIGRLPPEPAIRSIPGANPHFYGKTERPRRKVGHVTLLGNKDAPESFRPHLAQLLELVGETGLARDPGSQPAPGF